VRYSLPLPFHLADPAGVLFFSHVFTLFHQAFEYFIVDQLHCPWNEWFQNPTWVVPIKKAEAEYHSPLLAGEECHIDLIPIEIISSSFSLQSKFYQKKHCCTLYTVHVFCCRSTKHKIPIPSQHAISLQTLL
jgi:acyl-CoA thioester hydrolase/1,4-dihydroxy-2-naphthoyl-CoA hydrolase